jgi:hypothetical protein
MTSTIFLFLSVNIIIIYIALSIGNDSFNINFTEDKNSLLSIENSLSLDRTTESASNTTKTKANAKFISLDNLGYSSFTCPYYSTSATASATVNIAFCLVTLCPGDTAYIGSCDAGYCYGDQYLRLSLAGLVIASSDDNCGSCSRIIHTNMNLNCGVYTIMEGCAGNAACSGVVGITVVPGNIPLPDARRNVLSFNGKVYSTLADVPIDTNVDNIMIMNKPSCQSNTIRLPSNW